MRSVLAAAALAAAAAGCARPAAPAPAALPTPAAAPAPPAGPMADSADYANWKRFPVGTKVVRRSATTTAGTAGGITVVETVVLREATDAEVVVERQVTTEQADGSGRVENPPDRQRYPRQFPLPPGMAAETFAKPAPLAKRVGEEAIRVAGKEYPAVVYAWTGQTDAGPMETKVWQSDEMPGRTARRTMVVPRIKTTTVGEVTEVSIP